MINYCSGIEEDVFIVLNDIDTREEGIRVLELGEKEPSSLKFDTDSAWGRDGFTKISEDAFKGFTRVSRLLVNNNDTYHSLMDKIYAGLDVKVYYSDDNNKHRYGTIEDIQDNIIIGENREITISIKLQPFKYGGVTTINITKETNIVNLGNVYTLPIIRVYGDEITGHVYINDKSMFLYLDGVVTIDCFDPEIFNSDGEIENSRMISGDFFRIQEGNNNINFSKDIDRIEIDIPWRWR